MSSAAPSRCSGWTAADVVGRAAGVPILLEGGFIPALPRSPPVQYALLEQVSIGGPASGAPLGMQLPLISP